MGECGCNEPQYLRKFPGPGKSIYALEIHPGCPYCHTGVSVAVYLIDGDEHPEDYEWVDELPELEFVDGMAAVPVLDSEILKRTALRYVDGNGERILIEDALEDAHIDAVEGTIAAWEARR